MRKYHWLAVVGTLFLTMGFALLVSAQDAPAEPLEDPPYLAEYYFAWVESPHADRTAEAFVHWDSEGEIPERCAKCHSEGGYLDFLGADGSEAGVVNAPAPLGSVVSCDTCHNPAAVSLTTVVFPSGAEITDDGGSARCMQCHQGRASSDTITAKLTELNITDPNVVNEELSFINIHYYAAAATLYGSEARGGYQYEGQVYQMKNEHVPGYATCASCHNPHTLELNVAECASCHEDVETVEDLRFIRMQGSTVDYDGDGDENEGIAEEIETLQEMLYEAIQIYASDVVGTGIVYDAATYPYFLVDTNGNGEADADELNGENGYKTFTANLLEAAYNYQVTVKDPGGYAHNPQYQIQILFDSISALNAAIGDQVDMSTAHRNDPGHFNVTAEAFRHWDAEGEVPGSCARCHTDGGLEVYLKNGVNIAAEPSNSLTCSTCHDSVSEFTLRVDDEVAFPSGDVVTFGEGEADNLCLNCHQGRESTVSVNNAINRAGVGDDEVAEGLTFRNIHYFAAGASLFGGDVRGAYQFEGKEYLGRNMHDGEEIQSCTDCHQPHSGAIDLNTCEDCHEDVAEVEDLELIRQTEDVTLVDYDGDGDDSEPIKAEIESFQTALYAAIQAYATETVGTGIVYDSHSHPYWFIDTNGNGTADPEEVNGDNRFASWTPNLLRAAFNYQFAAKDPGAFAHNPRYIMQVLFDSIEAVGGADAVSGFTRPSM